ncbi:Sec-independent protein translocase protein TatB [Nocardia sp. RB20]|uniref:Sec-independent protein translocase protein TatB n=1 Tax=Nocardia macrotermitis TaxID=2585198 RepID=A0A7K0D7X9_9NOCA|nr:Sec-independent protein translocase protein TatB [Nocardia macrotermitis]MQY21827.1 Sec-independent protein translocase protein TatB [Nocardia macrotermitis]
MFGGIGWPEFMILLVAALVILGPERLPGAIQWSMDAFRQARDYVGGAADQLRSEIGPEMDEFREPLAQLRELRGMSPRDIATKYLLDGDDSILTGEFEPAPGNSAGPAPEPPGAPVDGGATVEFKEWIDPANGGVVDAATWTYPVEPRPVVDELPRFDLEAT